MNQNHCDPKKTLKFIICLYLIYLSFILTFLFHLTLVIMLFVIFFSLFCLFYALLIDELMQVYPLHKVKYLLAFCLSVSRVLNQLSLILCGMLLVFIRLFKLCLLNKVQVISVLIYQYKEFISNYNYFILYLLSFFSSYTYYSIIIVINTYETYLVILSIDF